MFCQSCEWKKLQSTELSERLGSKPITNETLWSQSPHGPVSCFSLQDRIIVTKEQMFAVAQKAAGTRGVSQNRRLARLCLLPWPSVPLAGRAVGGAPSPRKGGLCRCCVQDCPGCFSLFSLMGWSPFKGDCGHSQWNLMLRSWYLFYRQQRDN